MGMKHISPTPFPWLYITVLYVPYIVVTVYTGDTQCMIECSQCLGLQLYMYIFSVAIQINCFIPQTQPSLSWLDICLSKFDHQTIEYKHTCTSNLLYKQIFPYSLVFTIIDSPCTRELLCILNFHYCR